MSVSRCRPEPALTMEGTDGSQQAATEAYRRNPYPPMIHNQNNPDRFATIARLAGMTPPDVRTARVLEIGAGNGLNVLSLAQAFPDAQFTGFDLEAEAIADGNDLRAAAGLENVRLEVLDLLDAEGRLEESYDYVIAHGVFAWVPAPVAEAVLALIGRCLAPQGVAMVSFNALPGGYLRHALRDVMMRASKGATSPDEKLALAGDALRRIAEPRHSDTPAEKGYREMARLALKQDTRVMLHDELGDQWHPKLLADVLAQAGQHGLAFLGDISTNRLGEAFVAEVDQGPATQQAVEARACDNDEASFAMFRRLLLVRAEAVPARVPTPAVMETLFAASGATEPEPDTFATKGARVQVANAALAAGVRRLIEASPARIAVRDLALAPDLYEPLLNLFDHDLVSLHTVDAPFATVAGERPRTSPLARAMIARGIAHTATLAHRPLQLQASVAAAVVALDGGDESRFGAIIGEAGVERDAALANIAACALLMRD